MEHCAEVAPRAPAACRGQKGLARAFGDVEHGAGRITDRDTVQRHRCAYVAAQRPLIGIQEASVVLNRRAMFWIEMSGNVCGLCRVDPPDGLAAIGEHGAGLTSR